MRNGRTRGARLEGNVIVGVHVAVAIEVAGDHRWATDLIYRRPWNRAQAVVACVGDKIAIRIVRAAHASTLELAAGRCAITLAQFLAGVVWQAARARFVVV